MFVIRSWHRDMWQLGMLIGKDIVHGLADIASERGSGSE